MTSTIRILIASATLLGGLVPGIGQVANLFECPHGVVDGALGSCPICSGSGEDDDCRSAKAYLHQHAQGYSSGAIGRMSCSAAMRAARNAGFLTEDERRANLREAETPARRAAAAERSRVAGAARVPARRAAVEDPHAAFQRQIQSIVDRAAAEAAEGKSVVERVEALKPVGQETSRYILGPVHSDIRRQLRATETPARRTRGDTGTFGNPPSRVIDGRRPLERSPRMVTDEEVELLRRLRELEQHLERLKRMNR